MDKSPEAFRTISEVAEALETPAHVLRFWESRFPQIRPVKRAGGRRYYRPADVALLSGIRHLLHDEGMTIRGVQKILREQGVRHVASLGAGRDLIDDAADLEVDDLLEPEAIEAEPMGAEIVDLGPAPRPAPLREAGPGEVLHLHPASPPTASQPPAVEAPPQAEPEPAPEAGHVWVEDEPEFSLLAPTPLFPEPRPEAAARREPEPEPLGGLFEGIFPDQPPMMAPPKLSGLAARIRALPRPLSPLARAELEELHSRLGLLHAQMAEALRMRR